VAPRTYTLGRRAESASATRQRIIDTAVELYRDRGIGGTTLTSVAEKSDVSRGTILHHFGSADGLIEAVAVAVMEALEAPDERILDGIDDPEERIRVFIAAMVRFFQRSTPWWRVFESEMHRPELQAREAEYWATLARIQAAALGPELTGDRLANATVSALIHPATLGALISTLETSGLSLEEVIEVVGDLVVPIARRTQVAPVNI